MKMIPMAATVARSHVGCEIDNVLHPNGMNRKKKTRYDSRFVPSIGAWKPYR